MLGTQSDLRTVSRGGAGRRAIPWPGHEAVPGGEFVWRAELIR